VVIFGGDAPLCSILSFTVTVTGITLTPQGGGTPVSVLSGGSPITLDFASLMDLTTMLSFSSVVPGTYTALTVTLSNPQLYVWDTTKTPPAPNTIAVTFSSSTITLDLSPMVTVASNGTVGLQLDFNLLKAVQIDKTTGQITGDVTPTFAVSSASATGTNGFAEFEGLRGIVQSVATTSTNSSFTGNFTVQPPLSASFVINVSSSTKFDGISGLSSLTSGTFVEVDAFADANGNVVAKEVQAEEHEDASTGQAAFLGLITSVTRDSSGNATTFDLFVREEAPDVSSRVPLGSLLTVDVGSSTGFSLVARGTNFATLPFDPTTLAVGQLVVVHGQLSAAGVTPVTADARSIFLGIQSILGNLSVMSPTMPVIISSSVDPKTGGFTLLPCSPVFQSQPPITVVTYSQTTTFAGISDLNGLTSAQPLLLIKGLLFYQQKVGTVSGVTWGVLPANVQVASQVHQLP
jgi:hypothetical protein